MKRKKDLDKPEKVKTSLEELEVLARLKDTVEWAIVKRVAMRYLTNLRKVSFKLPANDPHLLSVRHEELLGEALGIKKLITIVDKASNRLEEEEK